MRTLSFLFWTLCSMAIGIWAATVPVGNHTPWEHAKRLWSRSGISMPEVPSLSSLRATAQVPAPAQGPSQPAAQGRTPRIAERHTEQERDAINRLLTHRAEK